MGQHQIAVVVGSLRRDSFNLQLAKAVIALAPPDFTFELIPIGGLPLYNQDEEDSPAESVKQFKAAIKAATAVLFVTPEYNRSVPGVLKNAIDHASRPYGQSAWTGKPASVMGTSIGAPGTSMAQQHLRNTLAYLDMKVMGQPEMFIQMKPGLFENPDTTKFLQRWMDQYVAWVKRFA